MAFIKPTWAKESVYSGATLTIVTLQGEKIFSLASLKKKFSVRKQKVHDPHLNRLATFEGIDLLALYQSLLADKLIAPAIDEIEFIALDGYKLSVPHQRLQEIGGIMAYTVVDGPSKASGLPRFQSGKKSTPLGPFYVVWNQPQLKPVSDHPPFAYQVAKIRFVSFQHEYGRLLPESDDAGIKNGFQNFKTHCLHCHAINQQGGNVGPELNIPKNITEYWRRDHLLAYISDASSYRLGAKMQAFGKLLKAEEIEGIVDYLEHMKGKKIYPDQP
jgi:mono/diheme cytochrome c family protein